MSPPGNQVSPLSPGHAGKAVPRTPRPGPARPARPGQPKPGLAKRAPVWLDEERFAEDMSLMLSSGLSLMDSLKTLCERAGPGAVQPLELATSCR